MAELHQLQVKITADASGVRTGMQQAVNTVTSGAKQMERSVGGVRSAFAALIPVLSVAALVNFGKQAIEAAGHLNDLAARIGFSASTLSALEPALAATGSSLDDFAASIGILNNQLGEAAKGNEEAVKAFDQLGLSVRKLQQMSPEQQFYAVTAALAKLESQAKFTEAGRNYSGGFLSMAPVIKDVNGNLEQHVQTLKDTKEALGQETIDRIDAFGDALSNAGIKAKNSFLEAFAAILKVSDFMAETVGKGAALGGYGYAKTGIPNATVQHQSALDAYLAKAQQGGYATEATIKAATAAATARGSNAGLIKGKKPDGDPIRDYLQRLKDQNRELNTPEPMRTAQKAEDELRLIALKEGKKLTQDQINLARELATANRELTDPSPVQEYIEKLQEEQEIYRADEKMQAGLKAYYDLKNQTKKDGIVIGERDKQLIIETANATEELKKKQEEAQQAARKMKDDLTDGLTDIILHFDDATDSAKRFFEEIASQILKKNVTGPLAGGISDLLGGLFKGGSQAPPSSSFIGPMPQSSNIFSGLGNILGFADGGSPPVGVPSMVGERGPEIFVPKTAGTIIPNHAMGGSNVTVQNTWNIGDGVTQRQLAALIPQIEARTTAAVAASIEGGGRMSRLVNRKS